MNIINLPFDKIYLESSKMSAKRIAAIRRYYGLTQVKFAELIDVKLVTYQKWEQGVRKPSSPAASLLCIAERYPEVFIKQRKLMQEQIKKYYAML